LALIDNLFGEQTGMDLNSTICTNSINASAAAANAYLVATLEATTPEVRRLFGEYLTQSLIANEGLTGLAIKNGWINPYNDLEEQLKMSYQNLEAVLGQNQAQV
jgi:spore coat protein CotF